jgi:uncharacterized membrane protein YdjX (TVP38/TMEM64 family)
MNKHTNYIAGSTILLVIISIFVVSALITPNLEALIQFSKDYPVLAPIIIISWRALAIIIPPIPGGLVSLALIPVFGWFWSFIYATIGLLIGANVAFFLARWFREPLVRKLVPLQQLHSWEDKLSSKKEFYGFLIIRLTTEPILDFISYIAGLSKISFWKFFTATFISLLPNIVLFYIGEEVYKRFYQQNAFLALILVLVIGVGYYIFINRNIKK